MRALAAASALLLLAAMAPAQAGVLYLASGYLDAIVVGQTTQRVHLSDPPAGGVRTDSSYVQAGREVLLSGSGVFDATIVAQAQTSARASGDGMRAEVWTSQQVLNPFQYGSSSARAEAGMSFSVTVLGAPGTSGPVRVSTRAGAGSVAAPFGGGARFSTASVSATATALALPPGAATCGAADCFASRSFGQVLRDGSALVGPVDLPWQLELTARAGDTLTILMSVSAQADNGYAVSAWFAAPWNGISPFAAEAGADAFAAGAHDAPAAGLLASLWLGPGLSLAPTAGLVQLPDGGYGFAAPVPEPSAGLLLAAGLLVVCRLAARRRAPS